MSVRFRKILADLLTRWGRTTLTVVGLAFGLFGVGSVLVAFLILADDLNANFRNTNPPNIVVDAGEVSAETLARLRALPQVAEVEPRGIVGARMQSARGRWNSAILYVVEDFQHLRVARFYPKKGAWPPPPNGVLVERDALFFLWRPMDEPLTLRLSDGKTVNPVFAGVAFDPGQAPARMEQMLSGFVSRSTVEAWGFKPAGSRLLVTVKGADAASRPVGAFDFLGGPNPGDAEAASKVARAAAVIRTTLEGEGVTVRRMSLQSKLQHPHQFQLNATLALLAGVALVCFALSAMLIINLVDSIMTGEQRAIGVMKAIGARSSQIARDYLIGVALLGLVSGLIALPLSLRLGRMIAKVIAGFLNFDLLHPTDPALLYAVVLGLAVLTPVVVATLRVVSTAGMPVREALARPGTARVSRLAGWLGALASPLPLLPKMAVRTLARSPRRTLLTGLSLALGLVFFLSALNLRASLNGTIDEVRQAKPYDLQVSFRGRYPVDEMRGWIAEFPNVKQTEFWSSVEGTLTTPAQEGTNPVQVIAAPKGSVMLRPQLIAGRWLDPAEPSGVVVTQKLLADEPLIRLGGDYSLGAEGRSARVRIVGVVKEFGGGAIYADPALVGGLIDQDGKANLMLITLKESSYAGETELAKLIEESVNQSDWRLGSVMTSRLLEMVVKNHLAVIADLLLIIAGLMLAIGALSLASSISVSVVERYREVGVLKAVGGRSPAIAALFAWEAVFIAVIGWTLSLAAAPWLSRTLSDAFGTLIVQYPFSYRSDPTGAPLALGVAVLIALIASALPIRTALSATALKALRTA